MKLNLTTWQRMACVQALNAQAGHISMLRKALRLLDVLELSPEEREQVGLVQHPNGNMSWQDPALRFELEIADRELAAFLRRAVEGYQGWPVSEAGLALDLAEQLGLDGV